MAEAAEAPMAEAAEPVEAEVEMDEEEALRAAKRLKVGELRAALAAHGEEEVGTKPVLVERLVRAQKAKAAAEQVQVAARAAAKVAAAAATAAAAEAVGVSSGALHAMVGREGEHKAGCGGTLVVCPTSVLANWQAQLAEHVPDGALRVVTWHGGGRGSLDALASADVVLTTYGTLASDWSSSAGATAGSSSAGAALGKRKDVASMYELKWHRIVLDEAHYIKNRTAQQCKAVLALQGERCWAITGTPMPNKADEVRIARIRPCSLPPCRPPSRRPPPRRVVTAPRLALRLSRLF